MVLPAPVPYATLKAYAMTRVDWAIFDFVKIDNPTRADLNRVRVQAQVQNGIDTYRLGAAEMTKKKLEEEAHSSSRMAKYMDKSAD